MTRKGRKRGRKPFFFLGERAFRGERERARANERAREDIFYEAEAFHR
jgi:hypothetical protein